ncbi:MAG TPA: hypothetical protein VFZ09_28665 [Archangium sp.]|uniref:hypothetical protein n=1 Tax=Archangium sp. TaxID=1872627 RepID=UPI002E345175|nr:hypothetical protein [Archangium sp.]HEX5750238.1 hypothetical protein [Archangium sp.]
MKKLLAALVFTLSTAALAQADDTQAQKNTQAVEENQKNDTSRVKTGLDATEVAPAIKDTVKKAEAKVGLDTNKDGTFKADKAFSVNGTVKGEAKEGITLARQGLPDANLDVRDQTKVMLDGKKVEIGAIPEGAQVRAKFQLEGQEPVAVEIHATSPKGVKKSNK